MDSVDSISEDPIEALNLSVETRCWAKSDRDKQLMFTDIYKEMLKETKKAKLTKPPERIHTPERIIIVAPQINRLAYDKQDQKTKAKMLRAACESPNIVTLFHQNKLFVNGKDANSKFISKTIPVQPINKNDTSRSEKTIYAKVKPKEKFSFLIKDFKSALGKIKHSNTESRISSRPNRRPSNPRAKKDFQDTLCTALQSIEKQCELSRESKVSDSVDNINKQQKTIRKMPNRINWTATKLQKLGNFDTELIKEFFEYEKYLKEIDKINADEISQSLISKSYKDIRDQAKLIKKILIKKKMKVL